MRYGVGLLFVCFFLQISLMQHYICVSVCLGCYKNVKKKNIYIYIYIYIFFFFFLGGDIYGDIFIPIYIYIYIYGDKLNAILEDVTIVLHFGLWSGLKCAYE